MLTVVSDYFKVADLLNQNNSFEPSRKTLLWSETSGIIKKYINGRLFKSSATRGQQTYQVRVRNSYSKQW